MQERGWLIIERTLFFGEDSHAYSSYFYRSLSDDNLMRNCDTWNFFWRGWKIICVWGLTGFKSLTTKKLQMREKLVVSSMRRGEKGIGDLSLTLDLKFKSFEDICSFATFSHWPNWPVRLEITNGFRRKWKFSWLILIKWDFERNFLRVS